VKLAGSWEDLAAITECLSAAGVSAETAAEKAKLFQEAFQAIPIEGPAIGLYIPGRIEVLGKHTDYAGGESIVAAIERAFCLVALPRSDQRVFLTRVETGQTIAVELSPEIVPVRGQWANYPMTVIRRICRNFAGPWQGAEIAFGSDLPPAAGMSSSSAFLVGIFLALAEINHLAASAAWQENLRNLEDLAGYLATVENGQSFGTLHGDQGVGTLGGSEDHTAILLSQPGHLLRYLYIPVRFIESISLPTDWVFAIAASGVVAEKTGAALEKYNAASASARRLVRLWQEWTGGNEPTLGAIARLGPQAIDRLRAAISAGVQDPAHQEALRRRLEHFLLENEEIIPQAAQALRAGDFTRFGQLVDRSQWGAEHLLGNQVPETIFLAHSARQVGAAAASAFGAGFGGAVWALVPKDKAQEFLEHWAAEYRRAFPQRAQAAQFLLSRPGPAAFLLEAT
jgi:galactokinase